MKMNSQQRIDQIDINGLIGYLAHLAKHADATEVEKRVMSYTQQILENVAYLCLDQTFVKDIISLRKIISRMQNQKLPIKNHHEAMQFWLNVIPKKWYNKEIKKILLKHRLLPAIYHNYNVAGYFNYYDYDHQHDDWNREFKTRKKTCNNSSMSLLDQLIIKNEVLPKEDTISWADPHITRGAFTIKSLAIKGLSLDDIRTEILIGFPIFATIDDMKLILDNSSKQIDLERSKILRHTLRKDRRKEALAKSLLIYSMWGQRLSTIAIACEELDGKDISEQAIRISYKRILKEIAARSLDNNNLKNKKK